MAITVVALTLQRRYLARRSYVTLSGKGARPRLTPLGPARWLVFAFCAATFVVVVAAPYLTLLAVSLSKSWGLAFWQNLTLQNYRFILFEYDVTRRARYRRWSVSATTVMATNTSESAEARPYWGG